MTGSSGGALRSSHRVPGVHHACTGGEDPEPVANTSAGTAVGTAADADLGAVLGSAPRRAHSPRRGRPGHDVQAVVAAGIAVFTERGYDGATMEDLAAALGIAKSSLYHHVSGKEEILQRALDRALGALEAVFDEGDPGSAANAVTAVDHLEHVVRRAIATLIAELPSVTLLLRVRGNSVAERAALERRRGIDARFAALVRRAVGEGALRDDLDPALVARLVFGTVNSLAEWFRPRPEYADQAAAVTDAVCAMVFDGLRAPVSGRP